ncbi:MAG: hypothetical protein KIT16_21665 [Rhodospirillaceae bacterium]|nr:hypothetical protein [Rhodospirillaceae bacterium]
MAIDPRIDVRGDAAYIVAAGISFLMDPARKAALEGGAMERVGGVLEETAHWERG